MDDRSGNARATSDRAGYGQYCPISHALDVVGERWSLLILRDMLLGSCRFNDLARGLPGLSRSLLSKRLRQLEAAGLVERLDGRYLLTEAGEGLRPVVFGLGEWGARWSFGEPDPAELDAELLVWWLHTRIDCAELPDRRVVLQLCFSDDRRRFWLLVERGEASVCLVDPGFEVDVTIRCDLSTLYTVWLGKQPLDHALRSGRLVFDGPTALVRRMPRVLLLSPIAPEVAALQPPHGVDKIMS
jgi:DNA-binding HxlR family transcriptional regulator